MQCIFVIHLHQNHYYLCVKEESNLSTEVSIKFKEISKILGGKETIQCRYTEG
jgi:hypothetical protein